MRTLRLKACGAIAAIAIGPAIGTACFQHALSDLCDWSPTITRAALCDSRLASARNNTEARNARRWRA
eukprot:15480088-Alexandrium_andersonii.AAC.1